MNHPDCIVIGGGVIGLSLAWELSKQGLAVEILERELVGRATSRAGAGIFPPANLSTAVDPIDRLRAFSHDLHPKWASELQAVTGIDNGYARCGGLYLARTRGEQASLLGQAMHWSEYEIEAERLQPQQLHQMEPLLANPKDAEILSAWYLPDECQIRNPDHLAALKKACELGGVSIRENTVVNGFNIVGRRIEAVLTNAGQHSAGIYCVAGGAWSHKLLCELDIRTGIVPIRGQMLLYKFSNMPIQRIVNEGNRYMVPRSDGHLLVGSNEEEVGFQEGTTPDVLNDLREWGEKILPVLSDLPIKQSWSGFRPASFDGFPYIGKVPDIDNAYVSTGHYRSGLHLSTGTASAMASLVTGTEPAIDLAFFSPARR